MVTSEHDASFNSIFSLIEKIQSSLDLPYFLSTSDFKSLFSIASNFLKEFQKKMTKHKYISILKRREVNWLNSAKSFILKKYKKPKKPFEDLSRSGQFKRSCELMSNYSPGSILGTASKILPKQKKLEFAKPQKIDITNAIKMYVDLDLTAENYKLLKQILTNHGYNVLPSLSYMIDYKIQNIYFQNLLIKENSVEVSLRELVTKTLTPHIISIEESKPNSLSMEFPVQAVFKRGSDGVTGTNLIKIRQRDPSTNDKSCFNSGIVLLQISQRNKVFYEPKNANSAQIVRPYGLYFKTETKELTNYVEEKFKRESKELDSFELNFDDKTFQIQCKFYNSMVDGKTVNILEGMKGNWNCYICKVSGKKLNNIRPGDLTEFPDNLLEYGISPLHVEIRCMEWVLQIAYALPSKDLYMSKSEKSSIIANTKKQIQNIGREHGLYLDMPSENFANTNDGNTAKK